MGVIFLLASPTQLAHCTVSELDEELMAMKSERDIVTGKLVELNGSHSHISHQFGKLVKSLPAHVSIDEHQKALKNIQRYHTHTHSKPKKITSGPCGD